MKNRIVLLGPPASGKGTQAELITSRLGIEATSPGAILREEGRAGTALGIEAATFTTRGQLVPNELVIAVVRGWLERNDSQFVFDGFPRTVGQADALEKMLADRETPLEVVIDLEVTFETIRDRVLHRLICKKCGLIVSAGLHVASAKDPCPRCGGLLERRADDTLETLEQRMREYHEKTEPLIAYYQERNLLVPIDASRRPDEVFADVAKILEAV